MQKHLLLFITTFCFFISCQNSEKQNSVRLKDEMNHLKLTGEIGFLTKLQSYDYLIKHDIIDSTSSWKEYSNSDTIAKYIQMKDDNYLIYFAHYSYHASHFLIKVDSIGNYIKHEYAERGFYRHFHKNKDFFQLNASVGGSGYGGRHLYIFTDLVPLDSLDRIPISYSAAGFGIGQELRSEMNYLNDSILIIDYELDSVNELVEPISTTTIRKFQVKYEMKNGYWRTKDSKKYEGLDL